MHDKMLDVREPSVTETVGSQTLDITAMRLAMRPGRTAQAKPSPRSAKLAGSAELQQPRNNLLICELQRSG